ncbi:MAG TPA: metal ABC transporter permease [Acidimicrobiales bacterium]|nr:metal ABC transporter permease [Acidimicrobiales bacterium]
MIGLLGPLIEPGFFANDAVRTALAVGSISAVVSAIVGTFTVIRGQSFAGHSLSDIGAAGGAAAYLVNVNPLWGFTAMNLVAAGAMELMGIRRPRGRDVATGIVLAACLGLSALFLYWDTTWTSHNNATFSVLFGSIFELTPGLVPWIGGLGAAAVALVGLLYRPLLLSSLNSDLAAARGVAVRLVGLGFLGALALAVSLSAITIGAILSTALLIGPAATSLRVAKSTGIAIALATATGLVTVWLAILFAYDSAVWTTWNWPVSFFVVTLSFISYVVVDNVVALRSRRGWRAGVRTA